MYKHVIGAFATIGMLAASQPAAASGFLLMNHGSRSTGRANAFVATASDPSAIFHNPAGITQLGGVNVYLGFNAIGPESTFTPAGGGAQVESQTDTALSPYIYATGQVTEMITVGLGVNPPYGLTVEWGEDSPGRDIIREQTLRTWFVTPVVGFDLGKTVPGLSVAAGVDLVPASAYLRRDILFGSEVGQVELGGDDFGVGGRIGVMYRPPAVPGLSFGGMFRLPITFDFEGEADFDIDDPALRAGLPPDGPGSVEVTVPAAASLGVAYQIIPALQAEVNVNYTDWQSYDELVIELPDGSSTVSMRNWDSKVAVRGGLEYAPAKWAVRAGYVYDPTPVPQSTLDFTLPDVDRHVVTTGFGIDLPARTHVDVGAWYLIPQSRETAGEPFMPREKGEYEVTAWVLTVGASKGF